MESYTLFGRPDTGQHTHIRTHRERGCWEKLAHSQTPHVSTCCYKVPQMTWAMNTSCTSRHDHRKRWVEGGNTTSYEWVVDIIRGHQGSHRGIYSPVNTPEGLGFTHKMRTHPVDTPSVWEGPNMYKQVYLQTGVPTNRHTGVQSGWHAGLTLI